MNFIRFPDGVVPQGNPSFQKEECRVNAQKFTQKSLEAIKAAQSLATEYSNMQIEQLHLLGALTGRTRG